MKSMRVPIPRFETRLGGPMNTQLQTAMTIEEVELPARLSSDVVRKVKSYVMSKMHTFDPVAGVIGADPVRLEYLALKSVNKTSGFVHPAGNLGPAELALLKVRGTGALKPWCPCRHRSQGRVNTPRGSVADSG